MEAFTVKMLFLYLRNWSSSKRTLPDESCVYMQVFVGGDRRAGPVPQQHPCAMNSSGPCHCGITVIPVNPNLWLSFQYLKEK